MSNTIADSINPNQDNLLDLQKLIQNDSDTSVSVSSDSPIQNILPATPQPIYNQLPEIPQYHSLMNNYPIMNNYNQIPQMQQPTFPNFQQNNYTAPSKGINKIHTTVEPVHREHNIVETSEVIEQIIAENKKNSSKNSSDSNSKVDESLLSNILGGYMTIKGIAISNTTILIAIIFVFIVGLYIWWSSKKERLDKEKQEKKREPLVTYNQQKRF